MGLESLVILAIITFLGLFFLVIKLPLWISLPVVKYPAATDVIASVIVFGFFFAQPTFGMFTVCATVVVIISILLYVNTRYRWLERALLSKVESLISECEHAEVIARNQKEYDKAINLRHDLQWRVIGLQKAIKEIR